MMRTALACVCLFLAAGQTSSDARGMPAGAARAGEGTSGLVSSAHPLATEAGLEMLRAGGNAFDAAVAVAAALNVVEPAMSGIGGYGTILLYDATARRVRFLNPSGRIPASTNSDVFREPTPGYRENRFSAKAVSTPGNLHAWEAMSMQYGRLTWAALFVPAIRLAADGFELDAAGAGTISAAFGALPVHARQIFGREGRALASGDRLIQRDLAQTLRRVAAEGAPLLYGGDLGRAVDAAMREAGGFLTIEDLKNDRAEWGEPIRITYRGHEVYTAAPPANAFDYLVRLGMMSQFDTKALGHNTAAYLHRFAEVTKRGFWARLRYAGDPEVVPPPLARLLSEQYWKDEVAQIEPDRAKPFVPPAAFGGRDSHTTHFVVADRWGNVVSATQTLGNAFGSRIMPAGTGIWLNDSLAYCTFDPKGNPMDAHAGRRKLSGDCPTIILRSGVPWAALGTPGGHTIGQTVPQIVMNLIDFGMTIDAAIAAPRISFVEPDLIAVEEGIAPEVRDALAARGHRLRVVRALGNAHGLTMEWVPGSGPARFRGSADPRGAGTARGY
jgi:gamma-glutamyltranspeptidase / glutathione hydrolase